MKINPERQELKIKILKVCEELNKEKEKWITYNEIMMELGIELSNKIERRKIIKIVNDLRKAKRFPYRIYGLSYKNLRKL